MRTSKGITLVALVVTIVILIILATISVNIVMNGGLINRSQSGKELHELQREKERLELIKGEVASDTNHVGKVTVDTYVEELIHQGITVEGEVTDNGDGSKTVITDTGYSVTIVPKGERDVEIIIDGKAGQLPPRIKKVDVEVGTDSIKVTVEAIRAESYGYEYREDDGIENGTWTPVEGEGSSVTITGIDTDKDYIIRAKAINEYGTVSKEADSRGEEESIANAPRLSEGMTPVKWNGANWEKTTEGDKDWYDYSSSSKKWANVVLGDSTFKTVEGKEVLDEDAAYSMLVWIPRYAYKIKSMYHQNGDATTAGKINLVFINTQNVNRVTGTKYSRDSAAQYPEATVGGAMSDYVVHPAFDFGTSKLSGFWVGKFESSHTECTDVASTGVYTGTDKTMMIKANVTSWRGVNIGNTYDMCLDLKTKVKADGTSVYGFNIENPKVDPHLIKNNEWGAIAYLSVSRYGKGNKPIWKNNSSDYITGNAGNNVCENYTTGTINAYNTKNGQEASTTGNITGIYDMSGGAWDYTAAYYNNGNAYLERYGKSLVEGEPKYKNVYENYGSESPLSFWNPEKGYYGDAVYETSSENCLSKDAYNNTWFYGYTAFAHDGYVFIARGAHIYENGKASVFAVYNPTGIEDGGYACRVVIPVIDGK